LEWGGKGPNTTTYRVYHLVQQKKTLYDTKNKKLTTRVRNLCLTELRQNQCECSSYMGYNLDVL